MKYRVFEYLTKEKKLYLTLGIKFGADFLAYEGDPLTCHAKYLVKVLADDTHSISVEQLVFSERMANSIKKDLLLAYQTSSEAEI